MVAAVAEEAVATNAEAVEVPGAATAVAVVAVEAVAAAGGGRNLERSLRNDQDSVAM